MKRLIVVLILCAPLTAVQYSCAPWQIREGMDELDGAIQRWEDAGLVDYVLRYHRSCFCPITYVEVTVEDAQVTGVVVSDDADGSNQEQVAEDRLGDFRTVPLFFELIIELDEKVDGLSVQFDPYYGYPTVIDVDPRGKRCILGLCSTAIDDEYTYKLALTPAVATGLTRAVESN